ncbi:uncharacterized protein LOC118415793 isoform X2 [Branchiostoma floridae]|uniref:Uridylate-specific endoribonuclease n=1 Tax=Branchiostoma floridae TaxID=7739 RepID=A0A9J7L5U4_BRAFL|nr:uncharacterized protein LOC118415793 isoform X2 [Branchiostoma floridae]
MESLAEELTCPVCLDLYEQPVLLPCAHSLCKRCAGVFFVGIGAAQKHVRCPSCRHKFLLPALGADGLLKNTTLRNIVDRYREAKNKTKAPKVVPGQTSDKKTSDTVKNGQDCDNSHRVDPTVKGGPVRHTQSQTDASATTPKVPTSTERAQETVGKHEDHGAAARPDTFRQKRIKMQSDICSTLWMLDQNHLWRGEDYEVDLYGDKLFPFVARYNLEIIPTYRALQNLVNNYGTGLPRYTTQQEENDARAFLNCCLDTEVMQRALWFLAKEGYVSETRKGFKDLLYKIWFTPYTRTHSDGVQRLSTAFEHVFVGETRCQHMMGLQNWLRLYIDEYQGLVQVYNCLQSCDFDDRMILTIDFSWDVGYLKDRGHELLNAVSSFFVGTSPEFELALYTVCFLAGGGERTEVVLGGKMVTIVTEELDGHLGSCYPVFKQQGPSGTEAYSQDNSYEDPLVAEGRDFLQYVEDQNISLSMEKIDMKMIYEEEYTQWHGRRRRTPFSQVLRTLERDGKVEVYYNHYGFEIISILV